MWEQPIQRNNQFYIIATKILIGHITLFWRKWSQLGENIIFNNVGKFLFLWDKFITLFQEMSEKEAAGVEATQEEVEESEEYSESESEESSEEMKCKLNIIDEIYFFKGLYNVSGRLIFFVSIV